MRKMKKTTGEILDCNEVLKIFLLIIFPQIFYLLKITEKNSRYVKNYGIWIKYSSRSGIHNMYREYRDTNLNNAVTTMCKRVALYIPFDMVAK